MDLNKIVVELHQLLVPTDGLNLDKRLTEIEKKELPDLFKHLNKDEQSEVLRLFSRRYGWIVPTRVQLGLQGGIRKLAMSSDDQYIAWVQADGKLMIWSLGEEKSYAVGIKVKEDAAVKFSHDHHYLYVLEEGKLQILVASRNWEVEREVVLPIEKKDEEKDEEKDEKKDEKKVLDIVVAPGDRHLIVVFKTKVLILERNNQWASTSYSYVGSPETFPNRLACSDDGTYLGLVSINEVQTINLVKKITHPSLIDASGQIITVDYSSNNHFIIIHKTHGVAVYRMDRWEIIYGPPNANVKKVVISPDCQYMIELEETQIHVVDLCFTNGKPQVVKTIPVVTGKVAFNFDGSYLTAVHAKEAPKVWYRDADWELQKDLPGEFFWDARFDINDRWLPGTMSGRDMIITDTFNIWGYQPLKNDADKKTKSHAPSPDRGYVVVAGADHLTLWVPGTWKNVAESWAKINSQRIEDTKKKDKALNRLRKMASESNLFKSYQIKDSSEESEESGKSTKKEKKEKKGKKKEKKEEKDEEEKEKVEKGKGAE